MSEILKPALHTFWQSFLGAIAMWWTASGADVGGVHKVSDLLRFGLSLLLAVVAAALSALLHTLKANGIGLANAALKDHADPGELQLIDEVLDKALAYVPERVSVADLHVGHAARLAGHPMPGPE